MNGYNSLTSFGTNRVTIRYYMYESMEICKFDTTVCLGNAAGTGDGTHVVGSTDVQKDHTLVLHV